MITSKIINTELWMTLNNHAVYCFYFDPLEQFDVFKIINFPILGAFTNLALLFTTTILIFICFTMVYQVFILNYYDYVFYLLYNLVRGIVKENIRVSRQQYFLTSFYLFSIIFLANLIGLIPYSFTSTSSFIVTFFLASTHFLGLNFVALFKNQWKIFDLFLPSGVPLMVTPFLIAIEFISYVARVFSLSIRLFANMMSGHALLKILSGFSWTLLQAGGLFCLIAMLSWITVTAISFLELLIAFLQAYVFVILITIYINDVLSSH